MKPPPNTYGVVKYSRFSDHPKRRVKIVLEANNRSQAEAYVAGFGGRVVRIRRTKRFGKRVWQGS